MNLRIPLSAELVAMTGQSPRWNFHKYAVDRSDTRVQRFASDVTPDQRGFVGLIEQTACRSQIRSTLREIAVNARDSFVLPDTQSLPDHRHMPIQKVGIKDLRYPVALRAGDGDVVHTVADFSMYVGLPHDVKGTHMSRFVEILERPRKPLDLAGFRALHDAMLQRLGALTGHTEMRFPYFVRKAAPVSAVESLLDYAAAWTAESRSPGCTRLAVEIAAPVTSLCPCSKKISEYGAHNQRSRITIRVDTPSAEITLEEIARIAEQEASCEIYGLLKRHDEKWVTERAYENPKFVEDLVRDIALRLQRDPRVGRFSVNSENFESIHNHSAFAEITGIGAAGDD